MAGGLARGEVRLYPFPHPDKQRPVVVLTRESSMASLSTVTVAPVTSTIRGVASEIVLSEADGMKARLGRRVAMLSSERMQEICAAVGFALGWR